MFANNTFHGIVSERVQGDDVSTQLFLNTHVDVMEHKESIFFRNGDINNWFCPFAKLFSFNSEHKYSCRLLAEVVNRCSGDR